MIYRSVGSRRPIKRYTMIFLMLFICIYMYIYIHVTRHYIIYHVWIHGYKIAIALGAAVPTNSQVLEVLEVGRVDTATGLSRLQCRAIIDQKDDTAAGSMGA